MVLFIMMQQRFVWTSEQIASWSANVMKTDRAWVIIYWYDLRIYPLSIERRFVALLSQFSYLLWRSRFICPVFHMRFSFCFAFFFCVNFVTDNGIMFLYRQFSVLLRNFIFKCDKRCNRVKADWPVWKKNYVFLLLYWRLFLMRWKKFSFLRKEWYECDCGFEK